MKTRNNIGISHKEIGSHGKHETTNIITSIHTQQEIHIDSRQSIDNKQETTRTMAETTSEETTYQYTPESRRYPYQNGRFRSRQDESRTTTRQPFNTRNTQWDNKNVMDGIYRRGNVENADYQQNLTRYHNVPIRYKGNFNGNRGNGYQRNYATNNGYQRNYATNTGREFVINIEDLEFC